MERWGVSCICSWSLIEGTKDKNSGHWCRYSLNPLFPLAVWKSRDTWGCGLWQYSFLSFCSLLICILRYHRSQKHCAFSNLIIAGYYHPSLMSETLGGQVFHIKFEVVSKSIYFASSIMHFLWEAQKKNMSFNLFHWLIQKMVQKQSKMLAIRYPGRIRYLQWIVG